MSFEICDFYSTLYLKDLDGSLFLSQISLPGFQSIQENRSSQPASHSYLSKEEAAAQPGQTPHLLVKIFFFLCLTLMRPPFLLKTYSFFLSAVQIIPAFQEIGLFFFNTVHEMLRSLNFESRPSKPYLLLKIT